MRIDIAKLPKIQNAGRSNSMKRVHESDSRVVRQMEAAQMHRPEKVGDAATTHSSEGGRERRREH